MANLHELPLDSGNDDAVNAVIEIPMGDTNKYEYDPVLDVFRLARKFAAAVHYPGNYGFIPSTLGVNGKPVAVLVLASQPSFTGCLVEVRPIGLLEVSDEGVHEAKVVAVGRNSPRFKDVREIAQAPQHLVREIAAFFSMYKDLDATSSESVAWYGVEDTWRAIRHAHQAFLESRTPEPRA
jgi:inorganic pyrophosphatase